MQEDNSHQVTGEAPADVGSVIVPSSFAVGHSQTNRELAEMIAKFRTPPGFSWVDLANDIETVLNARVTAGVPSTLGAGGSLEPALPTSTPLEGEKTHG